MGDECIVCSEELTTFDCVSSICQHSDVCKECINMHIENELNSKGNEIRITCPRFRCGSVLTYSEVRKFASDRVFRRYDDLLLKLAIQALPNFRWCKNSRCGSGQEHSTGDEQPIMTCAACGSKSCFTHDLPWHEGQTCKEFSKLIATEDWAATNAYIDGKTKRCPVCEWPIEKVDGCDHMTCRCGHEFCWLCLAAYDPIRKDGNHRHNRTCRYYVGYQECVVL